MMSDKDKSSLFELAQMSSKFTSEIEKCVKLLLAEEYSDTGLQVLNFMIDFTDRNGIKDRRYRTYTLVKESGGND